MNLSKYSKKSFEQITDDKEKREMLLELDRDIAAELKTVIAVKMEEIVQQLNEHGHSLKRNTDIEDIDETDFCERHGEESCGFRVGSTTTISSGYYGISDCEYFNDE